MFFRNISSIREVLLARKSKKSSNYQDLVDGVENSIKKYGKTYKLLEEYDQKAPPDPKELVRPKFLQNYLRGI